MEKHIYKNIYKDIHAELHEQYCIGRDLLEIEGITFSVFKERVKSLLVIAPDAKMNFYTLFKDYCYQYAGSDMSIEDFANFHFLKFVYSETGIRLKAKIDDRL